MDHSIYATNTTAPTISFNTFNEPQHCISPPPEPYLEGFNSHYQTSDDILAWGKQQQQQQRQQHLSKSLTATTTMLNDLNFYTQRGSYTNYTQTSPSTVYNNDSGFEQQQPSPLYNYNASPEQQHFYYPSFKMEEVMSSPPQQQQQPLVGYYNITTVPSVPDNTATIATAHNSAISFTQPIKTEEDDDDMFDDEEDDRSSSLSAKKNETTGTARRQQQKVPERKRQRRESHNAIERRRRNNINDNIKYLGELLPENLCQGKISKGTILKGSVAYIHKLNSQLAQCKARLQQLEYEVAAFNSYNPHNNSNNQS